LLLTALWVRTHGKPGLIRSNSMLKSCSKCGKIHDYNYKCTKGSRVYNGGEERKLRSTYAWAKKSEEIRAKAQFLCEVCRQQGIYNYKGLEVHHITKLRDNPQGLLDDDNLICLCIEHHKQADAGEIDKAYLSELALMRENGAETN